jgi:phosphate transport system ATP-binding protein
MMQSPDTACLEPLTDVATDSNQKHHAPIFTIRDLYATFRGRIVLNNISTSAYFRNVLAVIGPSGSGKSTLLRVMNRTLELTPGFKVTAGETLFKGINLYGPKVDARIIRKRICMVHQKPVAFPMSIGENVLFGIRFHKHWNGRTEEEVVMTSLERAGLWNEVKDRLRESASCLSVGQLQRLCIASALANDPEALLMDEPCSALDPVSTSRIEELILALKNQLPVIIVTHNISQARRIADRCLILFDGMVLDQGETDRIFCSPASQRVHDFISGRIG